METTLAIEGNAVLTPIADDVWIHKSDFCQSNAVVVAGRDGALLIDAGVTVDEISCLASDLEQLGQPVVEGFSTHPHWDHLLWQPELGTAPRYGTARCATRVEGWLADPEAKSRLAGTMIPADIAEQVPLDLLGLIAGLPADAEQLSWNGPRIRIIEHQAHATGHAALVVEDRGVLVAGDMLSDILIPMLDLNGAEDPIGDYLYALQLLDSAAVGVDVVVPGHGSVGDADQLRARIEQDRAYVLSLLDQGPAGDPRLGPAAAFGQDFLPGVHAWQRQRLAGEGAAGLSE